MDIVEDVFAGQHANSLGKENEDAIMVDDSEGEQLVTPSLDAAYWESLFGPEPEEEQTSTAATQLNIHSPSPSPSLASSSPSPASSRFHSPSFTRSVSESYIPTPRQSASRRFAHKITGLVIKTAQDWTDSINAFVDQVKHKQPPQEETWFQLKWALGEIDEARQKVSESMEVVKVRQIQLPSR
ncbi:uncharacterized protein LAESUDRAFT_719215 [Laetiporus sulphureus 93-53]|uniref:Uncharacterized protein n=1 Tax=Laetiporus sulphureus 93-53 TaxID=1314785 RepID=A0A165ID03_9APHY|nr:uncharacterized protein LAESUDRAFT_719215 [Laetiporus sulphureus 93-53]KZT12910.1 hypothetical protein LAESUDRAFT_719215 [Laetiporus sulphureus 93-53]